MGEDQARNASARHGPLAWLGNLSTAPFRFFFGDDVFISYARIDGISYAEGLASELARRGFACRIDLWETSPGPELPAKLRRALGWSKMFVLLGTPGAAASRHVHMEIDTFLRTGGVLIPVDLGGIGPDTPWLKSIEGLPIARETAPDALVTGKPSESIVARVENSTRFNKRNRRIEYTAAGALSVLVGAGALSAWQMYEAGAALEAAGKAETERLTAMGRADRAGRAADMAEKKAGEETRKAGEATREAERQQGLADIATRDAKQQQRLAAAARAQAALAAAEALEQTRLAELRTREAQAMTLNVQIEQLRASDPLGGRRHGALAVKAYRTYPNPRSSQLLAEAVTQSGAPFSRLPTIGETIVSRNGGYAASFDRERRQLAVYRVGSSLEPLWCFDPQEDLGSIQSLALSNDGRQLAIAKSPAEFPHIFARTLLLARPPAMPAAACVTDAARLAETPDNPTDIGDAGDPSDEAIAYELAQLRFSQRGDYLWASPRLSGKLARLYATAPHGQSIGLLSAKSDIDAFDADISPDSEYVAFLVMTDADSVEAVVRKLPDMTELARFKVNNGSENIAFTPDARGLVINKAEAPFLFVQDWRSKPSFDQLVTVKPVNMHESRQGLAAVRPERFAFLGNSDELALIRAQSWDSLDRSESVVSVVNVSGGNDTASLIGQLELPSRVDGLTASLIGEHSRLGVRADGTIVLSGEAGLTLWNPSFRYGIKQFWPVERLHDYGFGADGMLHIVSRPGEYAMGSLHRMPGWETARPSAAVPIAIEDIDLRASYAFAPGGKHLAYLAWPGLPIDSYAPLNTGGIRVLPLDGGPAFPLELPPDAAPGHPHDLGLLGFSGDGRLLAGTMGDGQLVVWDIATRKAVTGRSGVLHQPGFSAFSPNGKTLVLGNGERVEFIDLSRPSGIARPGLALAAPGDTLGNIWISAHGTYLAVTTQYQDVTRSPGLQLWRDWEKGTPVPVASIATIKSEVGIPEIRSVAFHPQEDAIFAVLDQLRIRVYRVGEAAPIVTYPASMNTGWIRFSPDGRRLIFADYEGYVLWPWDPVELAEQACAAYRMDNPRDRDPC